MCLSYSICFQCLVFKRTLLGKEMSGFYTGKDPGKLDLRKTKEDLRSFEKALSLRTHGVGQWVGVCPWKISSAPSCCGRGGAGCRRLVLSVTSSPLNIPVAITAITEHFLASVSCS